MLTTVGLSYDSPCCSFGCNNFSLNIKELKRYSSWETWITVTRITTWRFKNWVGILLCFSVHSCLLFVYVHCLISSITYIKNLMRCNYTDQSIKINFIVNLRLKWLSNSQALCVATQCCFSSFKTKLIFPSTFRDPILLGTVGFYDCILRYKNPWSMNITSWKWFTLIINDL